MTEGATELDEFKAYMVYFYKKNGDPDLKFETDLDEIIKLGIREFLKKEQTCDCGVKHEPDHELDLPQLCECKICGKIVVIRELEGED